MVRIDLINQKGDIREHYLRPGGERTVCGRRLADSTDTQEASGNPLCGNCKRLAVQFDAPAKRQPSGGAPIGTGDPGETSVTPSREQHSMTAAQKLRRINAALYDDDEGRFPGALRSVAAGLTQAVQGYPEHQASAIGRLYAEMWGTR